MADWTLVFREAQPITVETCAEVLVAAIGGPVTTNSGSFDSDLHSQYERIVTISVGSDVRFEQELIQRTPDPSDPNITTDLCNGTLRGPTALFAAKLAAWDRLRRAFARLGCADRTLAWRPAPIVDDAEAAGDTATAARLRADITAALVAEAPTHPFVTLMSTRADIPAVLAAYVGTRDIHSVTLEDCRLSALPADFANRFPNLEILTWADDAIDVSALRTMRLPSLTWLTLRGSALRQLTGAEVSGFGCGSSATAET